MIPPLLVLVTKRLKLFFCVSDIHLYLSIQPSNERKDLPREVVAYEDATQAYLQYKSSTANDAREQVKAMSDHQLIGLLAEYMIAAVGKDLSVMVCLKKTDAGWKHVVGVVDIGAKGDEKIDKWYERDMNLVRQFRRRMESR